MDLGSTLLSMVGAKKSTAYASQTAGRPSLLDYLKNPIKAGYTVYSETDYRDFTHKRSIRTADGWKYILTLESNTEELYNLTTDPEEKKNLAKDASAEGKLKELHEALLEHITNDLHADASAPATQGCLPVYQGECQ
jgi:arylsulfatase A-like enzyme